MLKVSDFYGYWFIETRSSIYLETTFMSIDENFIRLYFILIEVHVALS